MGNSKKIALGIGIAIILAVFTGFLSWQMGSDSENKCQDKEQINAFCCDGQALLAGPKASSYYYWTGNLSECSNSNPSAGTVDKSFCKDVNYYSETCSQTFKEMFGIIAIVVGVIALAAGIMLKSNMTIEGGLIGGAIINFIMGLVAYWDYLEGWLRVVLAGVILAGLVALAWYKIKD